VGLLNADDVFENCRVISTVAREFVRGQHEAVYGDVSIQDSRPNGYPDRKWKAGKYVRSKVFRGWHPPHPAVFLLKSVYLRCGYYDNSLRISADYEMMTRLFLRYKVVPRYIPQYLVRMRAGGVSNSGFRNIFRRMSEDLEVLRRYNMGFATLVLKILRKVPQYFELRG